MTDLLGRSAAPRALLSGRGTREPWLCGDDDDDGFRAREAFRKMSVRSGPC